MRELITAGAARARTGRGAGGTDKLTATEVGKLVAHVFPK